MDTTYQIEIVMMQAEHIDGVVAVHMDSFPGFFLTFLGRRFLTLLYEEMLKDPGSVMIAAVDVPTQKVVGFAVGVEDQSGFYAQLLQRRLFGFALASLQGVLRRPRIILRLLRALFYPRQKQDAATSACFMSMGVLTNTAGHGVGKQVASAFLLNMQRRGVTAISLTTDRDDNERTNRFHQKTGFVIHKEFTTPEGRRMYEYYLDLAVWQPPPDIVDRLPQEAQPPPMPSRNPLTR